MDRATRRNRSWACKADSGGGSASADAFLLAPRPNLTVCVERQTCDHRPDLPARLCGSRTGRRGLAAVLTGSKTLSSAGWDIPSAVRKVGQSRRTPRHPGACRRTRHLLRVRLGPRQAFLRIALYAWGWPLARDKLISEHIAKPLVQRTYVSELTFPSGSVTAASVTAVAMWLALYPLLEKQQRPRPR